MFKYEQKKERKQKIEPKIGLKPKFGSLDNGENDGTNSVKDNKSTFDSVTELNDLIKKTLENTVNGYITVTGELSNYKISNNNLFATLKDAESSISIVYWGYSYKNFAEFQNGDKVKVRGRITMYPKTGSYSLMISKIEKNGEGDLYAQMEQLKVKLHEKGYFDNKKQQPLHIKTLGIVTSLEGAALQDILYVLRKGGFMGSVKIYSCIVQGVKAPKSIANGIDYFNKYMNVDILLVTRGGGSFEDLVGFSSEEVIEALHKSKIYTISAVGHEIDFMLSDFVADYRAPTPSVAAETICNIQRKLYDDLENIFSIKDRICDRLNNHMAMLQSLKAQLINPTDKLTNDLKQLDDIDLRLKSMIKNKLDELQKTLTKTQNNLSYYDINNQLGKGFSIVIKGYSLLDSVKGIQSGQKLKIKLQDGELDVIVA